MSTEPEAQEPETGGARAAAAPGDEHSVERLLALLERLELAAHDQRAARSRQRRVHHLEALALEHLVALGGLTPGQLAKRLGLTSGGVSALVERLVDAGYVTRRRHPRDRRMRVLIATPEGERCARSYLEPIEAPAARAFAWLSDADRAVAGRLLQLLVELKEQAAAETPEPERVAEDDGYTPALLM